MQRQHAWLNSWLSWDGRLSTTVIFSHYHLVSTYDMPSTVQGTQDIQFHSLKQSHELSVTIPTSQMVKLRANEAKEHACCSMWGSKMGTRSFWFHQSHPTFLSLTAAHLRWQVTLIFLLRRLHNFSIVLYFFQASSLYFQLSYLLWPFLLCYLL